MEEQAWSRVLAALAPTVSGPKFATWLKPTKLISYHNGLATIAVPGAYAKDWLEQHALTEIRQFLSEEVGPVEEVVFVIAEPANKRPLDELPLLQGLDETEPTKPAVKSFGDRYSFETFIVGNNNRLAFAASQMVAEKPGEAYNPLFLYGGVGLGKTHLMQAIGHEIQQRHPKKKIIYTSCESFTSEFIQALQSNKIDEFKRRYRTVDVFLIDDIQFLVNKEGTQEEFFHTFNTLHQTNRQIVITSDRKPREITQLEDRLTSRFGWGMVADVQSPNIETRSAILQAKAEEKGVAISPEVVNYIASVITSNVRELEGSLLKLIATAELEGAPITKDYTKRVLKDLAGSENTKVSVKQVIKTVANYFDIEVADLIGKKRIKQLVYPRQLVMYILRHELNQSYPHIGEALGGKDHTTIIHGVKKIEELIKTDGQVESDLTTIHQTLSH